MRSKRIIGFSLLFVMVFLLIGLNTACASNIDDLDYNLSDRLESSPVSNAIDLDKRLKALEEAEKDLEEAEEVAVEAGKE